MEFHGQELNICDTAVHVGVPIASDLKATIKIESACRKGKMSFHSALSFCDKDSISINPLTSLKLYKSVVQSTFLYGCELWNNLTQTNIKEIEKFHHYCLKKIQYLPVHTRSAMTEALLGLGSLNSEIEKRKLLFFHKISKMTETCMTKKIFLRRLFLYTQSINNSSQLGFVPDLFNILNKYHLLQYLYSFMNYVELPPKSSWRRIIQKAIHDYEKNRIHSVMSNNPDFIRFKSIHSAYKPYHIWKIPSHPAELKLIQFIVRCTTLVPLTLNHVCPHCNRNFRDTLCHIVTSCESTLDIRNAFMEYIVDNYTPQFSVSITSLDNEELLQFLLGRHTDLSEALDEADYRKLFIVSASYVASSVKRFYTMTDLRV